MSQQADVVVLACTEEFESEDVFYTELDCWLDTRLGTLGKIDSKLAAAALDTGYRTRYTDEFPGISREDFKKAYAQRDVETLKMSVVTNVSFLMRRIIKDSLAIAVQQKTISKINIDVNVWPYEIEPGELAQTLLQCVRVHLYENANVRVIRVDPEKLTPEHMVDKYDVMVMYNWLDWVNAHREAFEKKGIPSVTLIAPQLFIDRPPTKEEQNSFGNGQDGDVFRITEKMFAPIVRLNLMPASLFSIIETVRKDNAEKIIKGVTLTPEDLERVIREVKPDAKIEGAAYEPPVIDLDKGEDDGEYVNL